VAAVLRNPPTLAARIVAAGKRRREGDNLNLPTDPTARAIILAGMKARGGPLAPRMTKRPPKTIMRGMTRTATIR
jgi:hypothetical protein